MARCERTCSNIALSVSLASAYLSHWNFLVSSTILDSLSNLLRLFRILIIMLGGFSIVYLVTPWRPHPVLGMLGIAELRIRVFSLVACVVSEIALCVDVLRG